LSRPADGAPSRGVPRVPSEECYVVDYDLPADVRRKRFYRAVRRYLREHKMEETGWSTYSVTFTDDEDFAWFLEAEARRVGGRAHVWRATRCEAKGTGGTHGEA